MGKRKESETVKQLVNKEVRAIRSSRSSKTTAFYLLSTTISKISRYLQLEAKYLQHLRIVKVRLPE